MPLDSTINKLSPYRILSSFIFLFIAIYLSTGLAEDRKVHGLIESYLPPQYEEHWISNLDDAYVIANKDVKTYIEAREKSYNEVKKYLEEKG